MTLVRALASYLVDFYNPPKTREQLIEESRLSQKEYQNLLKRQKKKWKSEKTRALSSFAEISKLIKHLSKGENQEKVS